MARYDVLFTEGAEQDLEEIHRYVTTADSRGRADGLLDELLGLAEALATDPERGHVPQELLDLGIREFRQVLLGPYRIVYRVAPDRVIVFLIADGRRDMRSVLERRLLRG